MARFIIRRLLWVIVLLIVVSFITFMIFYLFPSADPATLRAGKQATPERVEEIRKALGLADPWYTQYFHYMRDLVLHFNFGRSYQTNVEVRQELFDRLPATISLAVYWLGLVSLYLFSNDSGKIPIFEGAGSYPDGGLAADPAQWFGSLIL